MKSQILALMLGAAVLTAVPAFAMEDENVDVLGHHLKPKNISLEELSNIIRSAYSGDSSAVETLEDIARTGAHVTQDPNYDYTRALVGHNLGHGRINRNYMSYKRDFPAELALRNLLGKGIHFTNEQGELVTSNLINATLLLEAEGKLPSTGPVRLCDVNFTRLPGDWYRITKNPQMSNWNLGIDKTNNRQEINEPREDNDID